MGIKPLTVCQQESRIQIYILVLFVKEAFTEWKIACRFQKFSGFKTKVDAVCICFIFSLVIKGLQIPVSRFFFPRTPPRTFQL